MYNKLNFSIIPVLMLVSAILYSCNEGSEVGKEIIPPNYLMETTAQDTFKILAQTYRDDSITTNNITYRSKQKYSYKDPVFYGLLGSYKDPVFGDIKASFITEITRTGIPNFDPASFTFDSVKLFLAYDTVFMNRYVEQEIYIAELKDSLSSGLAYYEYFNPAKLNPMPIYSGKYTPKDDKILSIKLPYQFGKKLFDEAKTWKDTTFSIYFKGFYIHSNSVVQDAPIARFNLYGPETKMTIYYHNYADAIADTLKYTFIVSTSNVSFNLFSHNYSGANFLPDLDNPQADKDLVYLQGGGGLKVKIQVPELDGLIGTYGVNRAEIIISADPLNTWNKDFYPTPQMVELYYIKDDGTLEDLDEFFNENHLYLPATYSTDFKYVFDITYIAQQIVNRKKNNNGFMLKVRDSKYDPSRIILTSGKHNTNAMKLKLTLTKLAEE